MEEQLKSIQTSIEMIETLASSINPKWPEFEAFAKVRVIVVNSIASGAFHRGNSVTRQIAIDHILKYSGNIIKVLKKFIEKKMSQHRQKYRNNFWKLEHLCKILKETLEVPEDDYISLSPEHERVKALKSVTKTVHIENVHSMFPKLEKFGNALNAGKVTLWNTMQFTKNTYRDLFAGALCFMNLFCPRPSLKAESKKCDSRCYIEYLQPLINIQDSKFMKKQMLKNFPEVQFKTLLFIPRLGPDLLSDYKFSNNVNDTWTDNYENDTQLTEPSSDRVQVRLVSSIPFPKLMPNNQKAAEIQYFDKVIVHIHGGGFIGGSSFICQSFLRYWANEVGVPVFSIDYGLSPQHPFPEPLNDVWQVYYWLIRYSYKYLGININKIVITGDSAGGNIVNGLTIKCIESGFRVPDGLLLLNPWSNLDISYFAKSTTLGYEHDILNPQVMDTFAQAYLGANRIDARNPLVSACFANDRIIARFPKTHFIIPLMDPLYFDSERLAEKMLRNGVDVKINEYPEGFHGLINTAEEKGFPELLGALRDTTDILKEMLN